MTTESETSMGSSPRITPLSLDENISTIHFINAGQAAAYVEGRSWKGERSGIDCLTLCVLVLKNGFTVVGESACASPENYNKELGEKIALENAKNKMWPLMGYALKNELADLKSAQLQDDALGASLTSLLAHSYGNEGALSGSDARVILSHITEQAKQVAKFDGDGDGKIGGSKPKEETNG